MSQDELKKVAKKCLEDRGYRLDKFIVEGGQGLLYAFCDKAGDCTKKVVKIIRIKEHPEAYEREVAFNGIVNTTFDDHVTPKLYEHFVCDGVGFLVQERFAGDMLDLGYRQALRLLDLREITMDYAVTAYSEKQFLDMFALVAKLQESRTIHGDLRSDQFVENRSGKELALIDFGVAGTAITTNPESEYNKPFLGWQPSGFKSSTRNIPLSFWPYFNTYQLLIYFLEREKRTSPRPGFITLVYRKTELFYLEDALIFGPGTPYHIPADAIVKMNRFLYGQDEMPEPPDPTDYKRGLETLQQAFPGFAPYVPQFTGFFGRKTLDTDTKKTTAPPLPSPIKTTTVVVLPPPQAERTTKVEPVREKTVVAILPPISSSSGVLLKLPCELAGFKALVGREPVLYNGYVYGVFIQVRDGRRYVFRRNQAKQGSRWKPVPRSKLAKRLLERLGI